MNDPFTQMMSKCAAVGRVQPFQAQRTGCKVVGDELGIERGWFNHPFNFDPCWLVSCDGFNERSR